MRTTSEFLALAGRYLSIAVLYGLTYVEEGRLQLVWACLLCFYIVLASRSSIALRTVNTVVGAELFCEFATLDPSFKQFPAIDYFYANRMYNSNIPYTA